MSSLYLIYEIFKKNHELNILFKFKIILNIFKSEN